MCLRLPLRAGPQMKQEKKVPIVAKIPSAPKNKKRPTTQPTIVDSQIPFFFFLGLGGCKIQNEFDEFLEKNEWYVFVENDVRTEMRKIRCNNTLQLAATIHCN